MNKLLKLAERCEAAEGPDRELDGAIDRLLNDRPSDRDYHAAENAIWHVDNCSGLAVRGDGFARDSFCAADYTASLDAAITLVPEGWRISSFRQYLTPTKHTRIMLQRWSDTEHGKASTDALALCAAALRARASMGETNG